MEAPKKSLAKVLTQPDIAAMFESTISKKQDSGPAAFTENEITTGVITDQDNIEAANQGASSDYLKNLTKPSQEQINLEAAEAKAIQEQAKVEIANAFKKNESDINDIDSQIDTIKKDDNSFSALINPMAYEDPELFKGQNSQAKVLPDAKQLTPQAQAKIKELEDAKYQIAIDDNSRLGLEDLQNERKTLYDKYAWKGASTDTGFLTNPISYLSEAVENTSANLINHFSSPVEQMSRAEKLQYEALTKRINTIAKPIVAEKVKSATALVERIAQTKAGLEATGKSQSFGPIVNDFSTEGKEYLKLQAAQDIIEDGIREAGAYLNDEGAYDVMNEAILEVATFKDVKNTIRSIGTVAPIIDKANNGEDLTEAEKQVIEALGISNDIVGDVSDKQSFGYRTVRGLQYSGEFMRDIMIGNFATKGATNAISTSGKEAAKETAASLLRKGAGKTVARLSAGAINTVTEAANVGVQTLSMPFSFAKTSANNYIGHTITEYDGDGNPTVYVRDQAYNKFKSDYDKLKTIHTARREELLSKDNMTDAEKSELKGIEEDLGLKKGLFTQSLDEQLEKLKPMSWLEASAKGIGTTFTENIAERYTGKVLGAAGKGLTRIKPIGSLVNKIEGVGSKLAGTKIGRYFNDFARARKQFSDKLFGKDVVGGFGEEFAEEYAVAPMNALVNQDSSEISQLGTWQANQDIAAQTFIMIAGLGGGGNVVQRVRGLYNKDVQKARTQQASARKTIDNLRKSNTDSDVEEVVNLMTARSGFSISEAELKIKELRAKNKKEEANTLEKSMFSNIVSNAFATGTQEEFGTALNKLSSNSNLSEATRLNIIKASENLEQIKPVYEKYKQHPNSKAIVNLAFEKLLNKQSTEEVEEQISKVYPDAQEELEAFIAVNPRVKPYSLDQVMDDSFVDSIEDENDKAAYNTFVNKLEETAGPNMETYFGLANAKKVLLNNRPKVMVAFNEAIKPSPLKMVSNNFRKAIADTVKGIQDSKIDATNAEFNFNNELIATPRLIDEVINKLTKDWSGSLTEGKLPLKNIEAIRTQLLNQFDTTQGEQQIQEVDDINKIYENMVDESTEASTVLEDSEPEIPSPNVSDFEDEIGPEGVDEIHRTVAEFSEATDIMSQEIMATVQDQTFTRAESDNIDFDDYSTQPMVVDNLNDNQKTTLTQMFAGVYNAVRDTNNKKPTFEDVLGYMLNYVPKEELEQKFNMYKLGWQLNNLGELDFDNIYNSIFDPHKGVRDAFINFTRGLLGESPMETTPTQLADNTISQEVEIEKAQDIVTSFTEENVPVKAIGGKRINHAENKLAYSAIKYDEVEQADGTWLRVTSMTGALNLDENSVIDFRDLINPDMYNEGASLQVAVAPENLWPQINIVTGRDTNGKAIVKPFSQFVEEQGPEFVGSEAFKDVVPVLTYGRDGKPLSFIHDTNWYNVYNVADPTNNSGTIDPNNVSKAHWDLIQEGKENVKNLRRSIIDGGLRTITVSEKREGAFYTVANRIDAEGNLLPLMTINEANPQAEIGIQFNQGKIELGNGVSFENDKRKIINKKQIQEDGNAGDTWNIRRIGTDPIDGKQTWRAFKTIRYVSEEQLNTVRWAWAAQARLNQDIDASGKNIIQEIYAKRVVGTAYELSVDQAQKIVDDIRSATGYNISKWRDAGAFFKQYFQPRSNDKLSTYGNTLFTNEANFFAQHTSNEGLGRNSSVVTIDNGIVTNTNKKYVDYLKDNLQTDVKSFNVGTAERPVYATSIQPVILFDYEVRNGQEVEEPIQQLEVRNQEIQTISEVTAESTEDVSEILSQFEELKNSLGFNFNNLSAQPTPLISTEFLKNIFSITPGLSISQEGHIVDFAYNLISSAIDIKYKSKVSRAKLYEDLQNSYDSIVGPATTQVETLLNKLKGLDTSNPQISTAISEAEKILTTLASIKENWSVKEVKAALEAQGLEYTGQVGIVEKAMEEVAKTSDIKEQTTNDEEEQDEEDLSQRSKSFEDNSSLVESGKGKTTYRLRRFMAGIHRRNSDGSIAKGFLGLPQYVGFNEVYDTLFQLLGTGVYIQSDYQVMKKKILEMAPAYPWVQEFMDKMDKADEQLRKEFVYNYRKHALSMKFAMYSSGNGGTKLKVYDTNANEINRITIDGWRNNIMASPLTHIVAGEYAINKEVAQAMLDTFESWGTDKTIIADSEVQNWLSNFGIVLSPGYWNELKTQGFAYGKDVIEYKDIFAGSNTPIGLLHTFLKKIVKVDNTSFEDNEKNHPFGDMGGVLKALAKGESRYAPKTMSKSFRDAGKNISGLTAPTYITNRIDDLKRSSLDDKEFLQDLQSISITQDSLLLDLLSTEPDFASKLEVNYLGLTAFKQLGKKSSNFAGITDLNNLDHDMTKLVMFQDLQQGTVKKTVQGFKLRMGRMFLPTMSDKTQMMMLSTGVFNFMEDSVDAFKVNTDGEVSFTDSLRELLYDRLVKPELKRIINFHNNVGETDIVGYDKGAQIFNFIPALNNVKDSEGRRMIKHLAVAESVTIEKVETLFKSQMMDVVEDMVHSLTTDKMRIWEPLTEKSKEGTISGLPFFDAQYVANGTGNLNDKFRNAAYDFIINSLITNADTFTVIAGDPAVYSQDKNFKKSPIPFDAVDDNFFFEVSEKNGTNIGKRLALLIAPGSTLADSYNQEYLQIFLQDTVDISSNARYLISLFYNEVDAATETLLTNYDNNPNNQALRNSIRKQLAESFPSIADYFDIESTDAQEYTTVQEHLLILESQGRLSTEQIKQIGDKLIEGKSLTKEELSLVLQPIKPVYTGQILDKKQDISRTVYIKSSSWPLIPQVTAGTKLDALRLKLEDMERTHGMPVRASYQTANKVGAIKAAIDPFNEESLKMADQAILILNRNDFRIQQDVPFKSDSKKEDKVSMGTQIFKLLLGDGMLNEDGFSIDGTPMTGQEVYNYYNNSFAKLIELKKQKLYKELGLNKDGNSDNSEATIQRLQELLQKEAVKRGYLIQDIKGLELQELVDRNGNTYSEFRVPLWLSVNSNRYESLLNSIVSNRLMKHKVPGNAFVAGSESGFEFREDLTGIDKSRIIFLDGWNGKELLGVREGSTKSQVFAPSKFKTPDGKLVDLFQKKEGNYVYLERRNKKFTSANVKIGNSRIDVEIGPDTHFHDILDINNNKIGEIGVSYPDWIKEGVKPKSSDFSTNKVFISQVQINENERGRGLGKETYLTFLNDLSDRGFEISSGINTSESAKGVWNSLLKDGHAIKNNNEYIFKNKNNRTLTLKEGMISPELFNNFSFRTPTSSHVSASSIEIVGILPPEVGDLMIVPKNFTKQKGLDYDIDKETAYQLNHVVDYTTGKIEVLTEEHKDKALLNLRKLLSQEENVFNNTRSRVDSQNLVAAMDIFYSLIGTQVDDEFIEELQNTGSDLEAKIEMISEKYDEKLYENEFIKANLAIYNNPKANVQKKINKVLSIDFAKGQAELIESLNQEAKRNAQISELVASGMSIVEAEKGLSGVNNFTILSDEYQKQKMGLGAAGKLAIGIYSNYVTFHGLSQQINDKMSLMEGGEGNYNAKEVVIGNFKSTGTIGNEITLDGKRSIAEAFAEKQNTATDNEKEQILGRVNISGTTIGVDSLLTLLGFDQDENGNSIPYMLLSQPIIKEYVDKINSGKGIIAEYQKDLELKTIDELIQKYGKGEYEWDGEAIIGGTNGFISSNILTGNNLVSGIKYNGENSEVQLSALETFLQLNVYAKNLGKAQNVLNTNNLGKSIVESNMAFDNLKTFADNTMLSGVSSLIGDFVRIEDVDTRPEGYDVVGEYYVKATTPQGQIVVSGLVNGNRLWNQYFPYGDKYFEQAVQEIMMVANIDTDSNYKVVEARQDIIQEAKKYIYSRKGNGIFTESAHTERARLFMDTKENMSLANYLNSQQGLDLFKQNRLINKFTYEVNTNGNPSLIKFNNTISDNFDEKYLYNSFAEMILEDKSLPDWNGQPFSTKQLAQELITYAYIEGGVQEAIQFIKYVPIEYLSEVGVTKGTQFMSANKILQLMNPNRDTEAFKKIFGIKDISDANSNQTHTFVKQFIQHNPEKANQIKFDDKRVASKDFKNKALDSFILNDEPGPKFLSIKNKTKSKKKQDKFTLYENVGMNKYQRISVLGAFGMNEYDFANENAVSLLETVQVEEAPKTTNAGTPIADVGTDIFTVATGEKASTVLSRIANNTTSKYERIALIAQTLMPMVDDTVTIDVRDTASLIGGVGAAGIYRRSTNTIYLDPKYTLNVSDAQAAKTFTHELIHSISERELRKYYNTEGTIPNADAPAWVTSLHMVFTAFRNTLPKNVLEDILKKKQLLDAGLPANYSSEEIGLAYGATNIFEFVTTALTERTFQIEMSKVPYRSTTQTIWSKFAEVVMKILRVLSPDLQPGSLAEAALNETLNFIEQEYNLKDKSATFVGPQFSLEDTLEKEMREYEDFQNTQFQEDMSGPVVNDENTESLMPVENPFEC